GSATTVLNVNVPAPNVGFSHSANAPLSFCHRTPATPSPVVSPVPTTCQVGPGFWVPASMAPTVPCPALMATHIASAPLSFWNTMSSPISALKSLSPTTCQVGPGFGSSCMAVTVVPSICQSASAPLSFCQRMSALPLLPAVSNSAAALTCQSGVTRGSTPTVLGVFSIIVQSTSSPAWSRQRMSPNEAILPAMLT